MKARTRTGHFEDLGEHGGWRFTLELVVERELILVFSELYEAAFGGLRTRSIARQVLTEAEFHQQMTNSAVRKYIAWDAAGDPVGMCVLTTDLTTVPWISPEYFAARYPEHWERRAIWYINFLLAHPSQRHNRFLDHIIDVGVGELVEQGAICAYDMCQYNDTELGLGRRVAESFRRTTGVLPVLTDAQTYYILDVARAGARSLPDGSAAVDLTPPGGLALAAVSATTRNATPDFGPSDAVEGETVGTL